jgi:hypothetical protein
MGQFRGSFIESSGCGSRTIWPSAVFFFDRVETRDDERDPERGEGNDEAEVRWG